MREGVPSPCVLLMWGAQASLSERLRDVGDPRGGFISFVPRGSALAAGSVHVGYAYPLARFPGPKIPKNLPYT